MKIEFKPGDKGVFRRVQIARLDTRGKILDVEDATNWKFLGEEVGYDSFEKAVLNFTEYGEGKQSQNFKHNIDLDDFMVLAFDLSMGKKTVNFSDYKGSPSDKYPTGFEAREFTIKYDESLGKGAGAYRADFRRGPGIKGDKGQVSMSRGDAATIQSSYVIITVPEARRVFTACYNFFNNKTSAFLAREWAKIYGAHEGAGRGQDRPAR